MELPNGDLLAAWFQGSGERTADDVRIMGARLKKGSTQWTPPFPLADTPHLPDCNPVLFLNHEKKLFLVWIAVLANRWEQSILRVRTATDYNGGAAPNWNWQDNILLKPEGTFATEVVAKLNELPELPHGWAEYAPRYDRMIAEAAADPAKRGVGWMTRVKPLLLGEKKIILPLYSDGFNFSIMAISDDDGASWLPSLPLVGRGAHPARPGAEEKRRPAGPTSATAATRPRGCRSASRGMAGKGWSAATKTDIPNTASVGLLALQGGTWAFVGKRHRGRAPPLGFISFG